MFSRVSVGVELLEVRSLGRIPPFPGTAVGIHAVLAGLPQLLQGTWQL